MTQYLDFLSMWHAIAPFECFVCVSPQLNYEYLGLVLFILRDLLDVPLTDEMLDTLRPNCDFATISDFMFRADETRDTPLNSVLRHGRELNSVFRHLVTEHRLYKWDAANRKAIDPILKFIVEHLDK
jgi:hypothetical protein